MTLEQEPGQVISIGQGASCGWLSDHGNWVCFVWIDGETDTGHLIDGLGRVSSKVPDERTSLEVDVKLGAKRATFHTFGAGPAGEVVSRFSAKFNELGDGPSQAVLGPTGEWIVWPITLPG